MPHSTPHSALLIPTTRWPSPAAASDTPMVDVAAQDSHNSSPGTRAERSRLGDITWASFNEKNQSNPMGAGSAVSHESQFGGIENSLRRNDKPQQPIFPATYDVKEGSYTVSPNKLRTPDRVTISDGQRVMPPKTSHQRWKTFIDLPLETVYNILEHADPLTLLHMSRVTRFLRNALMTRGRRDLWARSLEEAGKSSLQLPPCPQGLNEPQWVRLVFELRCTYCNARVHNEIIHWFWLCRVCDDCLAKCCIREEDIGVSTGVFPSQVFVWGGNPADIISRLVINDGVYEGEYYMVSHVQDVGKRLWKASKSSERLETTFKRLAHRNAIRQMEGMKLYKWARKYWIAQRQERIVSKMRKKGYREVTTMAAACQDLFTRDPVVGAPRELTKKEWKSIKSYIFRLFKHMLHYDCLIQNAHAKGSELIVEILSELTILKWVKKSKRDAALLLGSIY